MLEGRARRRVLRFRAVGKGVSCRRRRVWGDGFGFGVVAAGLLLHSCPAHRWRPCSRSAW